MRLIGAGNSQETKGIAAAKHLFGILRLFGRKSVAKIVVYSCQCLGLIHIEFDGIEQQVAIPTFGYGFLRIILGGFIIQSLAQQQQIVRPRQKCYARSTFSSCPAHQSNYPLDKSFHA